MCLMLYMAADTPIVLQHMPNLSVEEVSPEREPVRQWLSLPHIVLVGTHTGCSCGFPSVAAEQPVEYYDGLFEPSEDRQNDLASVTELLGLIRQLLEASPMLELLPVWVGYETEASLGVVEMKLSKTTPETFLLNEHFIHRVVR